MSIARASLAALLQEESTKPSPLSSKKKKPQKKAKASRRQDAGAEAAGAVPSTTASQAPADAVPQAQADPPIGVASGQGATAQLSKRSGSAGGAGHPERTGAAARDEVPEWMMCPLSKVCNQFSQAHVVLPKAHPP